MFWLLAFLVFCGMFILAVSYVLLYFFENTIPYEIGIRKKTKDMLDRIRMEGETYTEVITRIIEKRSS